jgi:hypothetical protein
MLSVAETLVTEQEDNTAAAVIALENEVLHCADARRALNVVIVQKMAQNECCETERLAHNNLIS